MRSLPALTCLIALMFAAPAAADTAYITDRILAGLFATPELAGEPRARLPTGTAVEVIERREEAAHVRLGDGSEGWVRQRFLSEDLPAQSLLLRLADEHRRTQAELERLRKSMRDQPALPPPVPATRRVWPFAVVGLVCLVVGFALGALWLDYRYRERHGGFRI